ncbi:MAG: winged helix-turn-helix transcriptional regulator [Hyphomicrobiaceae bacterium]|nr:winged helix-turn-helix transcriptional regulator [Hyphomicrobiaceae bacterium]
MNADTLFRLLADPTRRALYERITDRGGQTVGDLTLFSGVSQPTVSKHLSLMKEAGLVTGERNGREIVYRTLPEGLEPFKHWLAVYGG